MCSVGRMSVGNVKGQLFPSDDDIVTTLVSNSPLVNYIAGL